MTIFEADLSFFEWTILALGALLFLQLIRLGFALDDIREHLDAIRDDTIHLRPEEPEPEPPWVKTDPA